MGHSQSYDLRNPETGEKIPVRGVRRVSREHQTDLPFSTENTEPFDFREEELRERIRREQLRKREEELESVRIKKHESREPIIDAYRQTHSPQQATVYNEFNHYDSLKHPSPVDPNTYFTLKRKPEINEGRRVSIPMANVRYDQVPTDPSPQSSFREVPREREIPVTVSEYPTRSSVFNGRISPLPLQEEVDPHPMPRYIPPMSPRYERVPTEGTHYSKTTTTTTYNIYRSASVPRFDAPEVPSQPSPKFSRTYSKASNLQKYPSPRPTSMYSKVPDNPRYDEVPNSPRSSTIYSRTSKLPKYDEVPRSPRPTSMYSKLPDNSRYESIPISPKPSSTYSKASNLHNIPTRYSRGTEVTRYSEIHINPSGYNTYSRSSKLPKYDEVPRSTMYSRSSNSSRNEEVIRSPSLHSLRVPTYDEVPYQKSDRSVTPSTFSRKSSLVSCTLDDHVAKPIRRTPVYSNSPSPVPPTVVSPVSSKRSPPPSPIYLTRRVSDVRRTPLDNYVSNSPVPSEISIRSSPPLRRPPTVHQTQLEDDLRKTPIENYVNRGTNQKDYPTEAPILRGTPSPPVEVVPEVNEIRPEKDLRSTPLEGYIRKDPTPPFKVYEISLEQELRETPLHHYVGKEPAYSKPSSPTVTREVVPAKKSSRHSSYMCPKLHFTPLEEDIPWTPLGSFHQKRS
ncbi:hypothetical protein CAEBREN_28696 [Caenorhabditis brenneri]|uniref:Uncharacterized protein n=1 Tax=Caenorhabditis brenneri TaxID=135651 RepID=G0PHU2_CAEBE|nr:hypothetical protein CAEBREN_28696 [Caenorhabditis brenneri]